MIHDPTSHRDTCRHRHHCGLHSAEAHLSIDGTKVYVTNSVKHFKFVTIERGRRLHKKPTAAEIRACNPWLQEEIRLIKPRVIVALGATAAQALLGKQFRVQRVSDHLKHPAARA